MITIGDDIMTITNETELEKYLSTLPDNFTKHKAFRYMEDRLFAMLSSRKRIDVSEENGVISFITDGITYKKVQKPCSVIEGLRVYTTDEGDLRFTEIYGANYDADKYFEDLPNVTHSPYSRTYLSVEYTHYIYDKEGVLNSEATFSSSGDLNGLSYDNLEELKAQVFNYLREPTWNRDGSPKIPRFNYGAIVSVIQRYKTALARIVRIEYDKSGQIAKRDELKGLVHGEYPHRLRVDTYYAKRDKTGYYKPYPPKPEDENKGEREKIDEVEELEAEYIRRFQNVLETSKTKQDYSDQYFALLESIGKEIEQLEKEASRSL